MDSYEAGTSNVTVFSKKKLYDIMRQQNLNNINERLVFLENYLLTLDNFSEQNKKDIKRNFSIFKSKITARWTAAHYKEEAFLSRNKVWLEGIFTMPKPINRSGRPLKPFNESSERSKRRKTQELRQNTDLGVLTHAAQLKLTECGKRDASSVLKEIVSTPKRASKYKKAFSGVEQKNLKESQITSLRALAVFIEADLSRSQYEVIRSAQKKLFPCYKAIQKEKQKCYPCKEAYQVSETSIEVNLQNLMDLTVTRLLLYLEEVLLPLNEQEKCSLILLCKWGCDGAQQAQYKQKFENDSDSDANIFQSSFVFLQLLCSINNKVIWQNPTTSSPRYCRPIRIRYVKETKDIIIEEINYIKNAINTLQKTKVTLAGNDYLVNHTMMMTMVDGKVCNAATQTTSTMKCYICGKTSNDFNNLRVNEEINTDALEFGLSILHARIRLFESLLHLSYKLPLKKWRIKSESEKNVVKNRKLEIQEKFRKNMGLLVDVPKFGSGNTNDGNTSRRYFENHKLSAEINGVDINLIYKLRVILETISSGHKIDIEKFSVYAKETAELYVHLYHWHPMTPTMHKVLVHGGIIIQKALLPIGQLSEEAGEARNKYFRLYRKNLSRKFSRISCNIDVFNRLLLNSDPFITGIKPTPKKSTKPFLKETIAMLLPAESNAEPPNTFDEDGESSNEELSSDEELW